MPERLRVAFFTDIFPRISNTFIINQMTGLLDRGHEVEIFARAAGDFERTHESVLRYGLRSRMRHLPIPHNRLLRLSTALWHMREPRTWHPSVLAALDPRRFGQHAVNLSCLYTTLSFLRRRDFDVLHVQFGKLALPLLPLFTSGALRTPLVVAFRGADLSRALQKDRRMYDELFEHADLLLPVSDYFRKRLEALGAPSDKIEVLHSGIDLSLFPYRERSFVPGQPVRALFIGRLTEKKGVDLAVEAVAQARARGRNVDLTVVGDGQMEERARELARATGIGERVRWLGRLDSRGVAEQLASAHLLIAPSVTADDGDQEGIPNVLKEAMACGLPVLSTMHSGIPELVEHGRSGYLVPEHDVRALTDRLVDLVDHPERWPAMGRAGRAMIEREFDIEPLNDRLVELYEGLMTIAGTPRARFGPGPVLAH